VEQRKALKYQGKNGRVPALFQTIKELEQANPMILLKKSRFVPCSSKNEGGLAKPRKNRESEARPRGALKSSKII
jgi:hypothetical protein